jgi:predicted metal-binding protein
MLKMKEIRKITLALGLLLFWAAQAGAYYVDPEKIGSPAGEICVICHRESTPGIYNQWRESAMGQAGVNCYDCHKADNADPDAFEHKEIISIVVTPKDCGRCHEKEVKEFESSHHAEAVKVLDSTENFFGEVVWGSKADKTSCAACHGSKLKVEKEGRLNPATWPNTGIGRINPDNSKGSCAACHTRHIFSREQARRPETCGRCHTGSSQPQLEVYSSSKHGVMYKSYRDRMNLDKRRWQAGRDYFQGPTCASCHMGAVPPQMVVKDADQRLEEALKSILSGGGDEFKALLPPKKPDKIHQGSTHDVSSRLSWSLSPTVSKKQEHWQEKRNLMQSVCSQCHSKNFVQQHYQQLDRVVELYNTKFGGPASSMRSELMRRGKLSVKDYDEKLDILYWKLHSSDGAKARNGAAMVSPNYTWGQGLEKLAERFESEFIPEVRRVLGRKPEKFLRKHGYEP